VRPRFQLQVVSLRPASVCVDGQTDYRSGIRIVQGDSGRVKGIVCTDDHDVKRSARQPPHKFAAIHPELGLTLRQVYRASLR